MTWQLKARRTFGRAGPPARPRYRHPGRSAAGRDPSSPDCGYAVTRGQPCRTRTGIQSDVAAGRDGQPYRPRYRQPGRSAVGRDPFSPDCGYAVTWGQPRLARKLCGVVVLAVWASCTPASLTNQFPVKNAEDQRAAFADFMNAPQASVAALVESLVSTQAEERVAAEYALDGWTTYALRPHGDADELAALESGLAAAVPGATTGAAWQATGAFLVGQLGKVCTQRSVETLTGLLHREAWAQDASLALQAHALPAASIPVIKAAETALAGATVEHREVLLHLLSKARVADPLRPERSRDAFLQAMAGYQPGDSSQRICDALVTLADQDGADAFPEISAAMDHPDDAVRGTARALMAACDAPRVSPWLLERLEAEDPDQRAEALELLTARQDPNALSGARDLLTDGDEHVRRAAYDACAALGDAGMVDDLLLLYVEAGKSDRSALLASLVRGHGIGVADRAHRACLASEDPKVRAAMLDVMGACMARAYVGEALAATRDNDMDVAKQAVKTVRRLAGPEQAEELIVLLCEPELVRSLRSGLVPAAVAAMNEMPDAADQVDPVERALPGTAGEPRCDLHRVLAGLRSTEALALLEAETAQPDEAIRDSAVRALCEWNGIEAVDPLLEVAGSTTNETHNALALRRLLQLVQQRRSADPEDEELREEARRRYEAALSVALREEEKTMVREALEGLTPDPETAEGDAAS